MDIQIKKLLLAIFLLQSIATTVSHAGIYRSHASNDDRGTYGNSSRSTESADNSGFGMFSTSKSGRPENGGGIGQGTFDSGLNRPGEGEGIGQNTPIGDGIYVLFVCCMLFVVLKIVHEKRKKQTGDKCKRIRWRPLPDIL
ncbi:MAG: hypothetical protein FWF52_04540 [Candidatus Azobacteroides sp.]|nr:hypothetical protein [Candidatus Azobacteroides sp.]